MTKQRMRSDNSAASRPRYVDGSDTMPRRATTPLCDERKVSKLRSAPVKGLGFLVQGFKKTAYPIEVVSLK
jgi:hypothetical protein